MSGTTSTTFKGPRPARTQLPTPLLASYLIVSHMPTHLYTMYLACASNIGDIILSSLLFAAINASIAPLFSMGRAIPADEFITSIPSIILWSWSNLLHFSLHNQKQSDTIAEDKLNKPWRPIPSGRLTSEQATRILYVLHPLCFCIALFIGGFVPYAVLTAFHLWYNEWGGASNGIIKNIHNGIGIVCFYAGPLEVVTQHSVVTANREFKIWLALLAAIVATTSHTQDFRDMKGDLAAGRRTIPLVYGDTQSRIFVAIVTALWTHVASLLWEGRWNRSLWSWWDIDGIKSIFQPGSTR